MGNLWLLIIIVIPLGITESKGYTNHKITHSSGLFLEGMEPVRFIDGHWTITTSFNLDEIEQHTISLGKIFEQQKSKCRRQIINYYHKMHEWLTRELELQVLWRKIISYNRPYNTSRYIDHRGITSQLTPDERKFYLKTLPPRPMTERTYPLFQTTHLISGIQDLIQGMDHKMEEIVGNITNMEQDELNKLHTDNCTKLIQQIDTIQDSRQFLMRTINEVIAYVKIGLLHPLTFMLEPLHSTLMELARTNEPIYKLVTQKDFRLVQLKDCSSLKYVFIEGKIIISLIIPLLQTETFNMYALHSFPTPQFIDGKIGIFASIVPTSEYLLVSRKTQQFMYMEQKQFEKFCQIKYSHIICEPQLMLYSWKDTYFCELALYFKLDYNPFAYCEVKLTKANRNIFIALNRVGTWLYSLVTPISGIIYCGTSERIPIELINQGILHLNTECQFKAETVQLRGKDVPESSLTPIDVMLSTPSNITKLLPTIKQNLYLLNETYHGQTQGIGLSSLFSYPDKPEKLEAVWWMDGKEFKIIAISTFCIIIFIIFIGFIKTNAKINKIREQIKRQHFEKPQKTKLSDFTALVPFEKNIEFSLLDLTETNSNQIPPSSPRSIFTLTEDAPTDITDYIETEL